MEIDRYKSLTSLNLKIITWNHHVISLDNFVTLFCYRYICTCSLLAGGIKTYDCRNFLMPLKEFFDHKVVNWVFFLCTMTFKELWNEMPKPENKINNNMNIWFLLHLKILFRSVGKILMSTSKKIFEHFGPWFSILWII